MNSWLRKMGVSIWGICLCLSTVIAFAGIGANAQTTVRMGESNVLSGIDNNNSGVLIAQSATLSQAATVTSLSLYVPRAAGKLYLGVYDASGPGGGPGRLLATTGSFSATTGWNTRNVVNQVALSAGNYWLAYLPSRNSLNTSFNTSGPARGVFYSYGYKAMPTTFATAPSQTNYHWSFYANLNATQADTSAPSVPANAQASAVSSSQINFSFSASTDNVGVTAYLIERCQGAGCSNFAQVAVQSALNYSNSGLAANTSYSYRVRARDAAGNMSAYSTVRTAITQSQSSTAIKMGESNVLSGIDNGNAGVLIAQSATLSQSATITSLSLYVPRAAGNLYLAVYDAGGPGGGPGQLLATTGSFAAVTGWNTQNVVNQVALAAGNYWLAYLPSSSSLDTSFNTDGPAIGVFYSYGYKAMPTTFASAPSQTNYHWSFYANLNSSAPPTPDTSAPSVPANGQASAISSSQINFSFSASTDNVGVTAYLIERCQGASCSNFAQIASQSAVGFSDSGLTASTSYSYRVRARDAAGNMSGYSAIGTAVTQAPSSSGFVLGQRPFAATSSWNKPIGANASYATMNWPASTGYNYGVAWSSYSPAVIVSKSTDPIVNVSIPDSWGWPAQVLQIRLPSGVTGADGTDGELLVIDGDLVHNFWQFSRNSSNSASASAYGRTNILTGSGWGSKNPSLGAGIVATGSSQMAGLLVQAETDAGEIQHALQITLDFPLQKPGFTGEALSGDGSSSSGIAVEGERFAIPKTTAMPSGLSPLGQKVFRAMQNYGVYNIDVSGGTTNLRAQANAYNEATMEALRLDLLRITQMLKKVTNF